ncbi:ubiquitin carboxyl-terminal hydrolase 24-like, partial [Brachionus plicatilis]
EIKKHLPSVILSSNQESYAIFDKLLNHKNSLIASRTRSILNLIPTNSQLVDLFDSIVLFDSNQSSLAQFFSPESNSLIKILYNLEVLSIRITNDENFKQKFINKSGLNLLIDIFDSVIDTDDNLVEQLLILLINLVDFVLLDQSEPMVKKSLVSINSKLIDLLLKTFIKKSTNLNFNTKISVKSINLVYNLICSNLNQIDCLIESSLFRTNIVNVLIGAKCSQIRHNLAKFFTRMSNLTETIKYKLIILILKNTRVPIWTNSTKHMRSSARNLISQSSEYFTLLSNLIENMSPKLLSMDSENELNAENLLKNQINWFRMFNLSSNLDQVLLNGQFGLTKAILTNCSSQIKDSYGAQLTDILIKLFLFQPFFSSCGMMLEQQTQQVGYDLLLELTKKSGDNFSRIKAHVCQFNQENKISECNFTPLVKSFKQKYLGLKNGGSTCYMNAVLQQLFMIPGICEYIQFMNNSNASRDLNHEKQLLFELENVFVHLKKSNQEFYSPERFWQNFRMWNSGDSINIREQQDAFDFFISLTDQIDEYIQKELKKEPVFKSIFEGKYSNQFICQDCEHSYDRQEAFLALNLSVKTFSNLEQSMAQFVKDELLTGDNSYLCEKCNKKSPIPNFKKKIKPTLDLTLATQILADQLLFEQRFNQRYFFKRSAIKRTCLKQLPNYLCIQLKRFDYDWESNQALKFDDYFEFPINLNVKPFTHDYLNKVNSHSIDCDYELCGIIVHSGQANAGHYYSFIKELYNSDDLIDEEASDTNASKWFKFNDTYIDEIKIDEKFLIEECFGGNFNKKDSYLPEERTRYWNAYMLFYKRKSFDSKSLFKVDDFNRKNEEKIQFRDSISELSDLVEQCDHKVKEYQLDKEIRIENLNLLKQNLIVNETYFQTIDLIFNFLFCIYFKLKNKLKNNFCLKKWFDLFDNNSTRQICIHIVEFFGQSNNLELLKSHLADNAVDKEIHEFITSLIVLIINRLESEHQIAILDSLMESLFSLVTNSLLNTNLNSVFKIIYSFVCSKDENVHAFLGKQKLFEQKLIDLICKSSLLQLKNFHILFEIVSVIELKKFGIEKNIFDDNVTVKQFIGVFEYINKDHLEHTLQLIKKFCNSEASCLMFIKQILLYLDESCLLQVDSRQIFELLEDVIVS